MTSPRLTLTGLNELPASSFVAALGEVFEHAAWVPEAAAVGRPYPTVTALHDAMMRAVRQAPADRQASFIGGHPELGSKVALAGALTAESRQEQGSLGLDRLSEVEFQHFERLNGAYRVRPLGDVVVKGKSQPVAIFELLGRADTTAESSMTRGNNARGLTREAQT